MWGKRSLESEKKELQVANKLPQQQQVPLPTASVQEENEEEPGAMGQVDQEPLAEGEGEDVEPEADDIEVEGGVEEQAPDMSSAEPVVSLVERALSGEEEMKQQMPTREVKFDFGAQEEEEGEYGHQPEADNRSPAGAVNIEQSSPDQLLFAAVPTPSESEPVDEQEVAVVENEADAVPCVLPPGIHIQQALNNNTTTTIKISGPPSSSPDADPLVPPAALSASASSSSLSESTSEEDGLWEDLRRKVDEAVVGERGRRRCDFTEKL